MTRPLVSIFLSTFNHRNFIEAAVQSVLQQDYAPVHLAIGDDGSQDGTAEIVRELARQHPGRITAFADGVHRGIVGNFNRILQACSGEFVAFLSGDDLFLPGKLRAQVAFMQAHPEVRLSCHDLEVYDLPRSEVTGTWRARWAPVPIAAASLVRYGNPFHPLGTMVRREAVPAGGFDARLPLVNDWKFFVDCCGGTAAFAFMDGVYAQYRVWSGNVSRRTDEVRRDLLATTELLEVEYPWLRSACRARRATVLCSYGTALLRRGDLRQAQSVLAASVRTRAIGGRAMLRLAVALLPARLSRAIIRFWDRTAPAGTKQPSSPA